VLSVRFGLNLTIQTLVGSFPGVIVPIPQRAGTLTNTCTPWSIPLRSMPLFLGDFRLTLA